MRISTSIKFGHDGEDRLEEGSKRASPGYVEFGRAWGATGDDWPPCQPLDQAPSPEPLVGLSCRCTRKERCERSREPHRFASEMKQCVRLTVHPSNISVSQYNVLVRTVRPGPRDVGRTLSPPERPATQCPSRGLGPTWPAMRSESRTETLQKVSLGLEERAGREILIPAGEEALCIMGGKTRTVITTMIQRVMERARVRGTVPLSVGSEGCVCRGRQGYDGSRVSALSTWWLALSFFQILGRWKRSLTRGTSVCPCFLPHANPEASLRPDPFTCNEASFTPSLYLPPPSLYALVINWVSSLYQYCLTFFSFLSLWSLWLSLSFLLYAMPFFSPFHSPLPLLGCSQLVLETYNVPELSAGVNCTFEDLSEMDGVVVGNQIQCYSPAAKEVPRIITENGEQSPEARLGVMASSPPPLS